VNSAERDAQREAASIADTETRKRAAVKRAALPQCPVCLRKYPEHILPKHRASCEKRKTLRTMLATADAPDGLPRGAGAARPADAPPSLRALAPTSTTIPLAWEAPL
jgi:tetratricopeptide (TPR) repeat protein